MIIWLRKIRNCNLHISKDVVKYNSITSYFQWIIFYLYLCIFYQVYEQYIQNPYHYSLYHTVKIIFFN